MSLDLNRVEREVPESGPESVSELLRRASAGDARHEPRGIGSISE